MKSNVYTCKNVTFRTSSSRLQYGTSRQM